MTLLDLDPDQLLSTTRAVRKRLDAGDDRVRQRVASSADYLGEHTGTRRSWCSAATRAATGPRP